MVHLTVVSHKNITEENDVWHYWRSNSMLVHLFSACSPEEDILLCWVWTFVCLCVTVQRESERGIDGAENIAERRMGLGGAKLWQWRSTHSDRNFVTLFAAIHQEFGLESEE
ncbi:hypothetical protein NQZ68_032994 [Dissostichus eleginoides]|nr:hypothetical protein NQZ68_032994 [Dissostichus eleginoides]